MNYTEYQSTLRSLQGILGMSCFEFWDTTELHPYVEVVLGYLNKELIGRGPAGEPVKAIKDLCEIIDQGNQVFLEGSLTDFLYVLGIDRESWEDWSDALFGVAWANICTSLWESAKCNYAGVLWELEHAECGCWCGCSREIDETDNLYSKLVGNGASFTDDTAGSTGCGCGA